MPCCLATYSDGVGVESLERFGEHKQLQVPNETVGAAYQVGRSKLSRPGDHGS